MCDEEATGVEHDCMRRVRADHSGARTPRGAGDAPGEYAAGVRVRHRAGRGRARTGHGGHQGQRDRGVARPGVRGAGLHGAAREGGDPRIDAGRGPRVGLRGEAESRVPQATGRAGDEDADAGRSLRAGAQGKVSIQYRDQEFCGEAGVDAAAGRVRAHGAGGDPQASSGSARGAAILRFPHADCDEEAGSGDQALGAVLGAGEGFRGDREGGGRGDCVADGRVGDGGAGEGGARGGAGSAAVDGEHAARNGNGW